MTAISLQFQVEKVYYNTMGIWHVLFADDDFTSLPGDLGRYEVDGRPVLDFRPPPPPPKRAWRRTRLCHDPFCCHHECERADLDDIALWFAPERLTKEAKFDSKLRFPMPAKYLKKRLTYTHRDTNSPLPLDTPPRPRAIHGLPWPMGKLAKPTRKQAKRFIKRHPQVILYLLERTMSEIGIEVRNPGIQAGFGNCIEVPMNATVGSWLGVTIDMKICQLAALNNDVRLGRYTVNRALSPGMAASPRCGNCKCMNPDHLVWEGCIHHRNRWGGAHHCVGTVLYLSRDGQSPPRREVLCDCGDETTRCITEQVQYY